MNTYIPSNEEFLEICCTADPKLVDAVRLDAFDHLIEIPADIQVRVSFFFITLNGKSYLPVIKRETRTGLQIVGMSKDRGVEFNDYNFFQFYVRAWQNKK